MEEICRTAGDSFSCFTWTNVLIMCWVSQSIVLVLARTTKGLFTPSESRSENEKDQRIIANASTK